MKAKAILAGAALSGAMLFAAACGDADDPTATPTATASPTAEPTSTAQVTPTAQAQNIQVAFSDKERIASPDVSDAQLAELVSGNNAFAMDLYGQLTDEDGNLFMSPYSISLALAMTYAGARGETATEMADALNFTLGQDNLHPAFNALDQRLASLGADAPADEKFTLEIVNSLWGQQGFDFEQAFLDTLAENYDSGMRLVDYVDPENREEARQAINDWVEDNTNDRIKDLLPEDVLNEMTRLVLVNAIFFKASWLQEFNPDNTATADFHLIGGGTADVEMMHLPGQNSFRHNDGDGYEAIELPYVGHQTSMVIILPDEGEFTEFESSLDVDKLDEVISDLGGNKGSVSIPKFEFESKFRLPAQLQALGMELAFQEGAADLTGMHQPDELFIKDVIHQSFVSVDEQGTEAAASTAVIVQLESALANPFEFVADSPFIFLVRDNETGTVLFMGRYLGPDACAQAGPPNLLLNEAWPPSVAMPLSFCPLTLFGRCHPE